MEEILHLQYTNGLLVVTFPSFQMRCGNNKLKSSITVIIAAAINFSIIFLAVTAVTASIFMTVTAVTAVVTLAWHWL